MVGYHLWATGFWLFTFWMYCFDQMVGDIKSIENLPLRTLVCFIGLLDTLSVMMFFATCVQIYFFHLKLAMENGATLETILRWSKPQEEYALNHETQRLIGNQLSIKN